MKIELEDFTKFTGGWSLSPIELYVSFKHIDFDKKIHILEFGAGDGTDKLVDFLKTKNLDFFYLSVEHDLNYCKNPDVKYFNYSHENWRQDTNQWNYNPSLLETVKLELGDTIFDFVIVDGPNGVGRANWYKKFKNNCRKGTVILIDDFHHYKEFSEELDKNFEYETISVYNMNELFTIINLGIEKIDVDEQFICGKTFKVVKITNIL